MKKLSGDPKRTKISDALKGMDYQKFKKFFDARYDEPIEPHLEYLGIKKKGKGDN